MNIYTEIDTDAYEREASTPTIFTDLGPYFAGDFQLEKPSVGQMWDNDHHLFYKGRVNEIHSEPGIGKTNVLIATVIAEIREGKKVLYIDPEDSPQGFVIRMRAMGASTEQALEYVRYLHNPTIDQIQKAQIWAQQNRPSLVILDGMAESIAAQGFDENEAKDVLEFLSENIRPFAEAGSAVVLADHVTKSSEGRGQFARGSGAKAGRYDGVSYEVVKGKEYRPGEEGFLKLKIQKDRNGGVGRRGEIYAELHFTPGEDGITTIATFCEPEEKQAGSGRPKAIIDKILKHLGINGKTNLSELRKIAGNTERAGEAIELLINEGKIATRKEGKNNFHFLVGAQEDY